MAEVKAKLSSLGQSPRKVRLVADLVRGKRVSDAILELDYLAKKASFPLKKLLQSGLANAKDIGVSEDSLKIKEIRVDEGQTMYRRRPASRGRAHPIRRRTSHIILTLTDEEKQKIDKKIDIKEAIENTTDKKQKVKS